MLGGAGDSDDSKQLFYYSCKTAVGPRTMDSHFFSHLLLWLFWFSLEEGVFITSCVFEGFTYNSTFRAVESAIILLKFTCF